MVGDVAARGRDEPASGLGVGRRALDRGVQARDQHGHALRGRQAAVELHQRRPRGIECQDLPVDALSGACGVVDLTEQGAVEGGPLLACGIAEAVDDRLRDVDAVGGDPHIPGHAVGVADLLWEFRDQSLTLRRCHGGDLLADAVLARRRPCRHHVGCLHRPGSRGNRRGGPRDRRRRERLLDVAGCVGVGGGESVQRVRGLVSQLVGPHREHVVRDDGVATGQRDEQRRGTGTNGHCPVIGDVESAAAGFGDPRQQRCLRGGDLVGAIARGDRRDDEVARRVVAGGRNASRVVPGGVGRGTGPEFVAAADFPHDGVDMRRQTACRLVPAVGESSQ